MYIECTSDKISYISYINVINMINTIGLGLIGWEAWLPGRDICQWVRLSLLNADNLTTFYNFLCFSQSSLVVNSFTEGRGDGISTPAVYVRMENSLQIASETSTLADMY